MNPEERGGSVVECLTWEWGVAGSSLQQGSALWSWASHFILCLVLDPSRHNWKNVDWDVKNQTIENKDESTYLIWDSYLK